MRRLGRGAIYHPGVSTLGLLVLFALLPHSLASMIPLGAQQPLTMHDPLPARVRYARFLVADAEYQLALQPHVLTFWHWQIEVRPQQPDPRRAFDDVLGIERIALDQPTVLTDLWRLRLTYTRLERTARLYQQARLAYTPDYAPLQTWLDFMDADLAMTLAHHDRGAGTLDQGSSQPQVGWN